MIELPSENTYTLGLRVDEGCLFIHLDIQKWGVSVARGLKGSTDEIKRLAREMGHDLVFAYTTDKRILKLWERCLPYDYLQPVPGGYVGGWETGLENG